MAGPLLDSPHDPGVVQPAVAGKRPRQRVRLLRVRLLRVVLVALAALPVILYRALWMHRFAVR
jgi:hypothetical protein